MRDSPPTKKYLAARDWYIVKGVYSGNDALPLETKDFLLRQRFPDSQFAFDSVTTDENGQCHHNPVRFAEQVHILELILLEEMGIV